MAKSLKIIVYIIVIIIAILATYFITNFYSTCNSSCQDKFKEIDDDKTPKEPEPKAYRLPTTLFPIEYEIKLKPFILPTHFNYSGSVNILVECKRSTNLIELNADGLEIFMSNITIYEVDNNASTFKVSKNVYKDEVLKLELDQSLSANKNYTIYIPFKGNLTNSLVGFYRANYLDKDTNETRYIAMTQFESTDARKAFPCWDEPSFKATFDIEITHFSDMIAISNMPGITNDLDAEWKKTKFDRTVKMSSYLVAFAVGDLRYIKSDNNKPEFRVYTRPSELSLANEVLNDGQQILKHFEEYFKIEFPLPKVDLLATPDLGPNAMENYGLVTFRESYILYDYKTGTPVDLYKLLSITSHELAHQWFGNLVTPKYFNEIWLNEGFATYMSFEGVNSVKPEWSVWSLFVLHETQEVFALDKLEKGSHQISFSPNISSSESVFDEISYEKAASVIRMLVNTIGESSFREGLNTYLTEFKYSNTNQDDLWRHLQMAYDKESTKEKINIKTMMDSWTLISGYPLVTVRRDYEKGIVTFSQSRFLLNNNDTEKLTKTQFEIPITYEVSSNPYKEWEPTTKFWLHKTTDQSVSKVEQELKIKESDWIIVNLQEIGYYRVNYDKKNWDLLIHQLIQNPEEIHQANRVQLLDDLFNLAENGLVEYEMALRALTYLKGEKDPYSWISLAKFTDLIDKMLSQTSYYALWTDFMRDLLGYGIKLIEEKGSKNELNLSEMTDNILSLAVNYDLQSQITSSIDLFEKFRRNSKENPIPFFKKFSVFCTVVKNGNETQWDFIFDLYKKEQNGMERNLMIRALTCSKIPWVLKRYLTLILDESKGIKLQDGQLVFSGIFNQNYGKDIAFKFLKENWDKIFEIYGEKKQLRLMVRSLRTLNSAVDLKEFTEFYHHQIKQSKIGSAKNGFIQALEQIESNLNWMNKYPDEIGAFLEAEKKSRN